MGDTDKAMDIRDRFLWPDWHTRSNYCSMERIYVRHNVYFGSATDIRSDPESENGKLDYVVVVAPVARNISL